MQAAYRILDVSRSMSAETRSALGHGGPERSMHWPQCNVWQEKILVRIDNKADSMMNWSKTLAAFCS